MILVTCSVGLIIFQYLVGAFIYYISRILPLYTRNENGLYSLILSMSVPLNKFVRFQSLWFNFSLFGCD